MKTFFEVTPKKGLYDLLEKICKQKSHGNFGEICAKIHPTSKNFMLLHLCCEHLVFVHNTQ